MIMAMVRIDKETKERELVWTPDMNEIDPEEEIEAALDYYGDVTIKTDNGITGEKYDIIFEMVG